MGAELITAEMEQSHKIEESRKRLEEFAQQIREQTGHAPLSYEEFLKQTKSFWDKPLGSTLAGAGIGTAAGGGLGLLLAGGALAGTAFFLPLAIGFAAGAGTGMLRGMMKETDDIRNYEKYLQQFAAQAQAQGHAPHHQRSQHTGMPVQVPPVPHHGPGRSYHM